MSSAVEESDEELDFMSDKFLVECTQNDVRPGLLYKAGDKRRHEQLKKQAEEKQKKFEERNAKKMLEETNRETGLSREISSENKGFKMLEKMGFKPGTSIGKTGSEGLKAPIRVEVKQGRGCLGQKTAWQEKRRKIEESIDPDAYRSRLQAQSSLKDTIRDLHKAQTVCRNLDSNEGLVEPIIVWYWPKLEKKKEDDDEAVSEGEEDDEESLPQPEEQLETIVNHLRVRYFYCIWCGTSYDDEADLAQSCPGNSREVH